MTNPLSNHVRRRTKRSKGDTEQLKAQLAPLEELKVARAKPSADEVIANVHRSIAHQEAGAIVVEPDSLSIAKEQRRKNQIFGLEPVVIVILGAVLIFIAFIAWQISQMPPD
jgi:hypothetical protein